MIISNGQLQQQLKNQLSQNQLFLSNIQDNKDSDRWNQLQMRNISPLIKIWKIQQIWLGKNLNSNIIREIQHIEFTNLKQISLDGNCIYSIQGMCKMRLPQFEKIILGHNRINKIGNLVKAYWPKLKDIHVFRNYIQDLQQLPKMKAIVLQWASIEYTKDDAQQSSDLRWVVKLQTPQLKALRLKNQKRIKLKVIDNIFQKKYKDISIKYKA